MSHFADANSGTARVSDPAAQGLTIRKSSRPTQRRHNMGTISSAWIADFGIASESEGRPSSSKDDAAFEMNDSTTKKKKYRWLWDVQSPVRFTYHVIMCGLSHIVSSNRRSLVAKQLGSRNVKEIGQWRWCYVSTIVLCKSMHLFNSSWLQRTAKVLMDYVGPPAHMFA